LHKKALAAIMTISLVLTTSVQVLADPSIDGDLNTYKNQYSQSQSNLSAAQKKYNDLNAQVQVLDEKISDNMNDIDNTNKKIDEVQANIDATQDSINKAQADIKEQQDKYNKMMKSMYTNESGKGYLGILLDSKGLSDFISKVDIIKKVTEYDNEIISTLNQRKAEVQSKEDSLAKDKLNLSALKDDSEKKLADLNKQKTDIAPLVAQAKAEQDAAIASSSSLKAQVDALNKKSEEMKAAAQAAAQTAAAPVGSVNRGGGSGAYTGSNAVISYASQFIGLMYKWGGTTPAGFDCSGFVQYVYGHNGVSLGRTTYDQIKDGTPVNGALQPGDLVFFGDPSSPHHVGIYVGNGQMIDSPETGQAIGIHTLYGDYSAARRVR
jgi:peptidoglycan hydrolase CwlO-like protein